VEIFGENELFQDFLKDHGVDAENSAEIAETLRTYRRFFVPTDFPQDRALGVGAIWSRKY